MDNLTFEQVDAAVTYTPSTGVFTWKEGRHKPHGSIAGHDNGQGYVALSINRERCQAHRAAWLLTHGAWPDGVIDHINGNPKDNRIENLRVASMAINRQNQQRVRSDSKTGYQGVKKERNCYRAYVRLQGTQFELGRFCTPEEANAAAMAGKRIHHVGFAG